MRNGLRVVLVIATLLSTICCGADVKKKPEGDDPAYPEPPAQHADWTPPQADVPNELVAATKRLFERGLADPRECEYRTVSVEVGSCWGGAGPVECHGWVLPSSDMKSQRFVVCWDGLVYPALAVKDKADLDGDIQSLLKQEEKSQSDAERSKNGFGFFRFGAACSPEGVNVSEKSMLPLKVCMLVRLGKAEAAHFWKLWETGNEKNRNQRDVYRELSDAQLWVNFDRAICAHMRGDDPCSLISAKAVQELRSAITKEKGSPKTQQAERDEYAYLDGVPRLIEDGRRRTIAPARTPALKLGRAAFATKAAWIAALVQDLELVSATQMGQPGGVDLGQDPIVEALIACGDDAVEPLLDCMEHDNRLTRSVHFWRDFAPNRMVIGTAEAAYVALSGILQTSFFSTGSTGDDLTAHGDAARAKLAQSMREYWKKYKGMSLPERWFATLADDSAGEQKWEEALSNIMRPVDVTVTPGSMFGTGWITTPRRKPGEKPPVSGESLRAKKNPSLVDLVARRIDAINALDTQSSSHVYQVAAASKMAIELSKWDPAAAKPIVRKQLDFCVRMFSNRFFSQSGESARPSVAGLASVLARAGDHSGLKVYGDWIRTITPHDLGASPERILSQYAYELSQCAGAPYFQYYWPKAQRDEAIKACGEFLQAYGDHLRYSDTYPFEDDFFHRSPAAHLIFPPLDHPASKEEAQEHRAIFSLEDQGERRLYKLPSVPKKGVWTTLTKYPFDQQYVRNDGKSGIELAHHQECWVWQAEELKSASGWQRYFGIVGPHEIAKVPASELEFPEEYGWTPLPNGLDFRIYPPGTDVDETAATPKPISIGAPLLTRIVIRNRRGIAQSLPTQFVIRTDDGKMAMRPGMTIVLTPIDEGRGRHRGESPKPLPAKPTATLYAEQLKQEKVLESTETFQCAEFDLRNLYDISQPGKYQIQVSFSKDAGMAEASTWPIYFELTANASKH